MNGFRFRFRLNNNDRRNNQEYQNRIEQPIHFFLRHVLLPRACSHSDWGGSLSSSSTEGIIKWDVKRNFLFAQFRNCRLRIPGKFDQKSDHVLARNFSKIMNFEGVIFKWKIFRSDHYSRRTSQRFVFGTWKRVTTQTDDGKIRDYFVDSRRDSSFEVRNDYCGPTVLGFLSHPSEPMGVGTACGLQRDSHIRHRTSQITNFDIECNADERLWSRNTSSLPFACNANDLAQKIINK